MRNVQEQLSRVPWYLFSQMFPFLTPCFLFYWISMLRGTSCASTAYRPALLACSIGQKAPERHKLYTIYNTLQSDSVQYIHHMYLYTLQNPNSHRPQSTVTSTTRLELTTTQGRNFQLLLLLLSNHRLASNRCCALAMLWPRFSLRLSHCYGTSFPSKVHVHVHSLHMYAYLQYMCHSPSHYPSS